MQKVLQWIRGLALVILSLAGCGGSLSGTTSPTPKIGRWQGEHLNFTVADDGKLQDLLVEGERAFDKNCQFSFTEAMPVTDGKFEYQVSEGSHTISLTLIFETETTASVSYSYTLCPNPASVSSSVQKGIRTAAWQEP